VIVSHKYKFIFIKTHKTAGTSIEVCLSQFCGPDDIVTRIAPHVPPHRPRNAAGFINHTTAREARKKLGHDIWNEYFVFCVERNPWDKTVSDYWMARHRAGQRLKWERYIARKRFPVDWKMYCDPTGELIVDRVLRYDRLNEHLGEVCRQLGIPWEGALTVHAKSEYRKNRKHYSTYYTPEQRQIVADAFAREIALFGWTFEDQSP